MSTSNFAKNLNSGIPELKSNVSAYQNANSSFTYQKPTNFKETSQNNRRTSLTPEDKSETYSLKTTTASNLQSLKTHDFSMKYPGENLQNQAKFGMESKSQNDYTKSKFSEFPLKSQKENDQPMFFPPNSFLKDPNMSTQTANFDGGSVMRSRENHPELGTNGRPLISKYLPQNNTNNASNSLQNIMKSNAGQFSQINLNNGSSLLGNYKKNVLNVQAEMMHYDEDFLPEDCLFLLGEEDNNLASFRENVEKEKAKLDSDMDIMMKDVMNIFDENKNKLQENIDLHYKNYISKYGHLKDLLIEFKNMKLDLPLKKIHPNFNLDLTNASNSNLIRELEDLRYQNQMSKMFNYITALQREKLAQIVNLSKELLQLSTQVPNYYNGEAYGQFLKEIKNSMTTSFSKRMQNVNDFVKSLLPKIEAPSQKTEYFFNENAMLSGTNFMSPPGNTMPSSNTNNPLFASPFPLSGSNFNTNNINTLNNNNYMTNNNNLLNEPPIKGGGGFQEDLKTYENKFQSLSNNLYTKPTPFSKPQKLQKTFDNLTQCLSISSDHLNCKVSTLPSHISLELSHVFKTNHEDILLCLLAVSDDLVAIGSKDSTISLWQLSSKSRIAVLEGHKGSICSLASSKSIKNCYLFSGSDHEDGSIIVWDLQNLNRLNDCMVTRLMGHNAAVVALLSLNDGQTLISGSYDKEIVIWNIYSGKIVQKLAGHNSSITALTLTQDQNKFISASLDNTLNVWKLNYKDNMGSKSFESCYLERTIKNNTFICSLNTLSDNKTIVTGAKDGKIKFWSLETGECDRVLTANLGPIVELLILDSNKGNENEALTKKEIMGNIATISCSSKDQNLVLTNVGNGGNAVIDVQSKVFIEYGCGVNPKIQMMKRGEDMELIVINQSEKEKVFSIWTMRMN